jgi:hypothetical protein
VRTLDLQLRPPATAPGAAATTTAGAAAACGGGTCGGGTSPVSALEKAIQRAGAQHGEAQQIQATYEQICTRLKKGRVSFDQQIAALERTLALKRHDLQELVLLSMEAGRACDAAQQELGKRKAACEKAHAQREGTLREKQQLIQQRLRRRKETLRAPARVTTSQGDATAEEAQEGGTAAGSSGAEEHALGELPPPSSESEGNEEAEEQRLAERKRLLEALRQAHRRVKDAVGVGTVEGVMEKVAAQAETLESLGAASRENQARLERLQAERDALRAAVERSRFAPQLTRSQEEVAAQLARDEERLGHLQLKHQQLAKLLKG